MKKRLLAALIGAVISLGSLGISASDTDSVDIASMDSINKPVNQRIGTTKVLEKESLTYDAFKRMGFSTIRMGRDWFFHDWDDYRFMDPATGKPDPKLLDKEVMNLYKNGLQPTLEFTAYSSYDKDMGRKDRYGYDLWFEIGAAYAKRFQPNGDFCKENNIKDWGVTHYAALNEPGQPGFYGVDGKDMTPQQYYDSIKGYADGIHSINPELRVSPVGFTQESIIRREQDWLKAIAPLFNDGTLYALDIHTYNDLDYNPIDAFEVSTQFLFDDAKKFAGITADIKFCTTEINYVARKDASTTQELAAKGLMTVFWNALGVTGNEGKVVSDHVILFNAAYDLKTHPGSSFEGNEFGYVYGFVTDFDKKELNPRGNAVQMITRLTDGMDFISSDPYGTGEYVLTGNDKTLTVWQNRYNWTNHPDSEFKLNLPQGASKVEIYRYDSWDCTKGPDGEAKPYRTIELSGEKEIVIEELPEDETLMFMVDADTLKEGEVPEDPNEVKVRLDNKKIEFPDQKPIITNGRTLVHLRAIFEAMDAKIKWDDKTNTVTANKKDLEGNDVEVVLTIGDKTAFKNKEKMQLDVEPQLINERTMVPLRFIGEAFDCEVEWIEAKNQINLTSPKPKELQEIGYGKTTLASSTDTTYPGYGSDKINDGDYKSYWVGQRETFPADVTIDLEKVEPVRKVSIHALCHGVPRVQEFEILASEDGNEYTTIVEKKKMTFTFANSECQEFIFDTPINAQFIKVVGSFNNAFPAVEVAEVEVFK